MLELLLSHWVSYLFLAWVAVILVVNLWPTKKSESQAETVHRRPKGMARVNAAHELLAKARPIHPNR